MEDKSTAAGFFSSFPGVYLAAVHRGVGYSCAIESELRVE